MILPTLDGIISDGRGKCSMAEFRYADKGDRLTDKLISQNYD